MKTAILAQMPNVVHALDAFILNQNMLFKVFAGNMYVGMLRVFPNQNGHIFVNTNGDRWRNTSWCINAIPEVLRYKHLNLKRVS